MIFLLEIYFKKDRGVFMTVESMLDVVREGIYTILLTAAPALILALVVGLMIGIFQAVTSINEQTLTMVPKILVVMLTLVFLGGWMLENLIDYFVQIFNYYFTLI
jgi:flagellar biosynthetic protein FliQ